MYRIVLCEDNDIQRSIIKNFIIKIFDEISNQVDILEFRSGEEMLNYKLDGIDIFFLDIQMDKISGMDVAKTIRQKNDYSEIIFITALIDYIQDGYKVRAYRYLLKPIEFEDLKEQVLNCIAEIIRKRDNFIIIEGRGTINKIEIDLITYIEVNKKNITIHTLDDIYCTRNSIEKLEKELKAYNFFRCHKSYLINMKRIEHISKNMVTINGEEVPVSKYRIGNLKTKLTHVLGAIIC